MAQTDPDMFQQLMSNMTEEKLAEFINEQELQSKMHFEAQNMRREMGIEFELPIDPHYIVEEEEKQHDQRYAEQ